MKRIISLLSVFAIIATMFTTVAMADEDNYIDWEIEEHTANKITFLVYAQTNQQIDGITANFTLNKFNSLYGLSDDDFTTEALNGTSVTARTSQTGGTAAVKNILGFTFVIQDGTTKTGRIDLGRISIDLTDVKEFPLTVKKFVVSGANKDLTSSFTNKLDGKTIAAKATEEPKLEGAGGDMINPATGLKEKTYITGTLELAAGLENPVVEITDEEGVTKDFEAADWYPQVKGEGTVNVIAIVRYAGDTAKTFTLKLK